MENHGFLYGKNQTINLFFFFFLMNLGLKEPYFVGGAWQF